MLERLIIKGFKYIKTMDLELRPLNILMLHGGGPH
jgi:predicted ATPase